MPQKSGSIDCGVPYWGVFSIDLSSASHVLVQTEWENAIIICTGNPGAGRTLTLPSALEGGIWVLINSFSTAQTATLLVSGQTGIAVAQSKTAILRGTATDIARVTADT